MRHLQGRLLFKSRGYLSFFLQKQIPSQKPGFKDSAGQIFNADVGLNHTMQCQKKQNTMSLDISSSATVTWTDRLGHEAFENTTKRVRQWKTSMSHFGFPFWQKSKWQKSKWQSSPQWTSPWSVYFATRPHDVRTGSTQMRLSLEKVIGWRLQWQGFPLRDEYTIGPRGACWKRAFSLQVAPCGNSISGVVGGPQLGLSVGV